MESLITIASFPLNYQAHNARNFLHENGIECFLADDHLQDANWLPSPISGAGVRLRVMAAHEKEARALIAQFEQDQRGEGAEVDWESVDPSWSAETFEPSNMCPSCQSSNTERVEPSARWQFFSVLLLNIPLLLSGTRYVCHQCEHRWKK